MSAEKFIKRVYGGDPRNAGIGKCIYCRCPPAFSGCAGTKKQAGSAGLTGPTGPTGPSGLTAATIPFSISKYGNTLITDERGEPQAVVFSGFGCGYSSPAYLQEGEWESGHFTIQADHER